MTDLKKQTITTWRSPWRLADALIFPERAQQQHRDVTAFACWLIPYTPRAGWPPTVSAHSMSCLLQWNQRQDGVCSSPKSRSMMLTRPGFLCVSKLSSCPILLYQDYCVGCTTVYTVCLIFTVHSTWCTKQLLIQLRSQLGTKGLSSCSLFFIALVLATHAILVSFCNVKWWKSGS